MLVVRISRRFADEHARGRTDRSFYSLIVAGSSHRDFDAITVQHLRQKLTSPAIRVICDNHMRSVRENGKERGRNCGHAAGKQQAIFGAFELRQLLLGDTLRRVAITAVLLALDTSFKMVAKLMRYLQKCRWRSARSVSPDALPSFGRASPPWTAIVPMPRGAAPGFDSDWACSGKIAALSLSLDLRSAINAI